MHVDEIYEIFKREINVARNHRETNNIARSKM